MKDSISLSTVKTLQQEMNQPEVYALRQFDGSRAMKTFITFVLASVIWAFIFIVKGTYFEVHELRNDQDYIIEGVWKTFALLGGVLYGGLTVLVLKLVKWLKTKWP
jgi:hypothetical protein